MASSGAFEQSLIPIDNFIPGEDEFIYEDGGKSTTVTVSAGPILTGTENFQYRTSSA